MPNMKFLKTFFGTSQKTSKVSRNTFWASYDHVVAQKSIFPPGDPVWVNEPARASEPLGVHWGNFAESRVLKQTWLRDGRTDDGRTGQDLNIFIFMGERFRGQLNPLWVSQFGMYSSHWIESRTRYAYKKYTCDLFDSGDENYIIFCSLEEFGWEFCFEGQ